MTDAQIASIRAAVWLAYVDTHCHGNGGRHTTYDVDAKTGRIYVQGMYGRMYVDQLARRGS